MASFEIVKLVGHGAFSTVYCARNSNKTVAIKCLVNEVSFQRELMFLNACLHTNVVRALWSLPACDGSGGSIVLPFFRHVLHQVVRNGSVSANERLVVAKDMSAGIAHLHSRAIVHCDLKPSNVLVKMHGKRVVKAVVSDLGSASFEYEASLQTARRTTLAYSAPEVVCGSYVVSRAIDVWAWACVLYEMIAKHPLFSPSSEVDHLRTFATGFDWLCDGMRPYERTLMASAFAEAPNRCTARMLVKELYRV